MVILLFHLLLASLNLPGFFAVPNQLSLLGIPTTRMSPKVSTIFFSFELQTNLASPSELDQELIFYLPFPVDSIASSIFYSSLESIGSCEENSIPDSSLGESVSSGLNPYGKDPNFSIVSLEVPLDTSEGNVNFGVVLELEASPLISYGLKIIKVELGAKNFEKESPEFPIIYAQNSSLFEWGSYSVFEKGEKILKDISTSYSIDTSAKKGKIEATFYVNSDGFWAQTLLLYVQNDLEYSDSGSFEISSIELTSAEEISTLNSSGYSYEIETDPPYAGVEFGDDGFTFAAQTKYKVTVSVTPSIYTETQLSVQLCLNKDATSIHVACSSSYSVETTPLTLVTGYPKFYLSQQGLDLEVSSLLDPIVYFYLSLSDKLVFNFIRIVFKFYQAPEDTVNLVLTFENTGDDAIFYIPQSRVKLSQMDYGGSAQSVEMEMSGAQFEIKGISIKAEEEIFVSFPIAYYLPEEDNLADIIFLSYEFKFNNGYTFVEEPETKTFIPTSSNNRIYSTRSSLGPFDRIAYPPVKSCSHGACVSSELAGIDSNSLYTAPIYLGDGMDLWLIHNFGDDLHFSYVEQTLTVNISIYLPSKVVKSTGESQTCYAKSSLGSVVSIDETIQCIFEENVLKGLSLISWEFSSVVDSTDTTSYFIFTPNPNLFVIETVDIATGGDDGLSFKDEDFYSLSVYFTIENYELGTNQVMGMDNLIVLSQRMSDAAIYDGLITFAHLKIGEDYQIGNENWLSLLHFQSFIHSGSSLSADHTISIFFSSFEPGFSEEELGFFEFYSSISEDGSSSKALECVSLKQTEEEINCWFRAGVDLQPDFQICLNFQPSLTFNVTQEMVESGRIDFYVPIKSISSDFADLLQMDNFNIYAYIVVNSASGDAIEYFNTYNSDQIDAAALSDIFLFLSDVSFLLSEAQDFSWIAYDQATSSFILELEEPREFEGKLMSQEGLVQFCFPSTDYQLLFSDAFVTCQKMFLCYICTDFNSDQVTFSMESQLPIFDYENPVYSVFSFDGELRGKVAGVQELSLSDFALESKGEVFIQENIVKDPENSFHSLFFKFKVTSKYADHLTISPSFIYLPEKGSYSSGSLSFVLRSQVSLFSDGALGSSSSSDSLVFTDLKITGSVSLPTGLSDITLDFKSHELEPGAIYTLLLYSSSMTEILDEMLEIDLQDPLLTLFSVKTGRIDEETRELIVIDETSEKIEWVPPENSDSGGDFSDGGSSLELVSFKTMFDFQYGSFENLFFHVRVGNIDLIYQDLFSLESEIFLNSEIIYCIVMDEELEEILDFSSCRFDDEKERLVVEYGKIETTRLFLGYLDFVVVVRITQISELFSTTKQTTTLIYEQLDMSSMEVEISTQFSGGQCYFCIDEEPESVAIYTYGSVKSLKKPMVFKFSESMLAEFIGSGAEFTVFLTGSLEVPNPTTIYIQYTKDSEEVQHDLVGSVDPVFHYMQFSIELPSKFDEIKVTVENCVFNSFKEELAIRVASLSSETSRSDFSFFIGLEKWFISDLTNRKTPRELKWINVNALSYEKLQIRSLTTMKLEFEVDKDISIVAGRRVFVIVEFLFITNEYQKAEISCVLNEVGSTDLIEQQCDIYEERKVRTILSSEKDKTLFEAGKEYSLLIQGIATPDDGTDNSGCSSLSSIFKMVIENELFEDLGMLNLFMMNGLFPDFTEIENANYTEISVELDETTDANVYQNSFMTFTVSLSRRLMFDLSLEFSFHGGYIEPLDSVYQIDFGPGETTKKLDVLIRSSEMDLSYASEYVSVAILDYKTFTQEFFDWEVLIPPVMELQIFRRTKDMLAIEGNNLEVFYYVHNVSNFVSIAFQTPEDFQVEEMTLEFFCSLESDYSDSEVQFDSSEYEAYTFSTTTKFRLVKVNKRKNDLSNYNTSCRATHPLSGNSISFGFTTSFENLTESLTMSVKEKSWEDEFTLRVVLQTNSETDVLLKMKQEIPSDSEFLSDLSFVDEDLITISDGGSYFLIHSSSFEQYTLDQRLATIQIENIKAQAGYTISLLDVLSDNVYNGTERDSNFIRPKGGSYPEDNQKIQLELSFYKEVGEYNDYSVSLALCLISNYYGYYSSM